MKFTTFVAALLLSTVGCTPPASDQLSPQEKDQITKEVKAAVDGIVNTFAKLDVDGALQYYRDSPEFVSIDASGARFDYAAMKKSSVDFVNTASVIKITTVRDDCTVLTKTLVICAWAGTEEVTLKSGDKVTYDPFAVTLVFRNVGGKWQVMYSHESGTIATQKAGKKK